MRPEGVAAWRRDAARGSGGVADSLALLVVSTAAKSSRRPISDNEIRLKKEACYKDIENGLWGSVCKSSPTEKENCVLRCLSPECYDLIYGGDPLEEGELDYVRGQEYKYCMHKLKDRNVVKIQRLRSSASAWARRRRDGPSSSRVARLAVFALILSLFELSFEKVIRVRTARWVLRMQMYTNLVASVVSVVGLLASGEWRTIPGEMASFKDGRARYVLTLVGTAVSWQAAAVGVVRLIMRVSSLFANVTCTLALPLPLVPVFAVVLFGDRMTGIKIVAMLMAVWGFLSYMYQHYIDGRRAGKGECRVCATRAGSDAVRPASTSALADDELAGKSAYEVLGVGETSSSAEIKASFHRLAKETHTDVAAAAGSRRFLQILAAYEVRN